MIPQFHGTIKNGRLALTRGEVFSAYIQGQPEGDYYLTLTKAKGPSKTLEQLGYYFAVIVPTVYQQLVDDGNETFVVNISGRDKELPLTKDIVDLLLKQACGVTSKAKMSIKECSEFIDKCIRWSARYLGCVIPPPI